MAPPEVSGAKPGDAPPHRERASANVVPAVPRALERRREPQDTPQSIASNNESFQLPGNVVVDSSSSAQSDLNERGPGQAQDTLPSAFFQAHNLSEGSSSSDPLDRTRGISSSSANAPLRTPLYFGELPSRNLPLQTPSSSGASIGSSRPQTSSTSGQAPPPSSHPFNQHLVFGRDSSSPETSPTLTPSATSTSDNHPTPVSDLTSQTAYQGYGHAPQPPPFYQPPPQPNPTASSLMDLSAHLVAHFDHGIATDVKIKLVDRNGKETFIVGHFVVLTRSPPLAKILKDQPSENSNQDITSVSSGSGYTETDHQGRKVVRLCYNHPDIDSEALKVGVKALYGADVGKLVHDYSQTTEKPLRAGLTLVAVGNLLDIDDLIQAGSKVVIDRLNLDTVEEVLESAFAESIHDPQRCDSHGHPNDGSLTPAYGFILDAAVSLLVSWVPPHFAVDRTVDPLPLLGGLPVKRDGPEAPLVAMPARPAPAATESTGTGNIQFGALPLAPGRHLQAISRILLSAPVPALEPLLQALGQPALARQVIAERQARRLAFLRGWSGTSWGELNLMPPRARWSESLHVRPSGEVDVERELSNPALLPGVM